MNPAVVSVAVGGHYPGHARRMVASIRRVDPDLKTYVWIDDYPPGSPSHQAVPYAFKFPAMQFARAAGHDCVLWLDSAQVAHRPFRRIFDYISQIGWYFQPNGWNVGQWCHDAALKTLRVTREEAFGIPDITGCIFGLNFANPKAVEFFDRMVALSQDGVTFPGPWKNDGGSCSSNAGVLGHRHDQTAMSVLRHQMGMEWRHSEHPWMCYAGPGVAEKETTLLINT